MSAVPGTHEPGFTEPRFLRHAVPQDLRRTLHGGLPLVLEYWSMGECTILVGHEPEGVNGEMRWHLSISHPSRHPTWDEIKTARYKLLPLDMAFAMILPPPEFYVNVAAQDHVFHLHEIEDTARFWETM